MVWIGTFRIFMIQYNMGGHFAEVGTRFSAFHRNPPPPLRKAVSLTSTLVSRAVIDNACIDESTKKTLSIIDIEEGTTY